MTAVLNEWLVIKRQPRAPIYSINWDDEPDLERFRRARATQRSDPRQGLQALEELAELGSVAGMCHVGYAYRDGNGAPKNLERAEFWFRRATDNGCLEGSFLLGALCRSGGRYEEALAAYSIGALQDFPPSIYWMGRMYADSMGVEANANEAIDLWRRASDLGHFYAARNLAIMQLHGRFGLTAIPRGIGMLFSVIWNVVPVAWHDPNSNFLR